MSNYVYNSIHYLIMLRDHSFVTIYLDLEITHCILFSCNRQLLTLFEVYVYIIIRNLHTIITKIRLLEFFFSLHNMH